MLEHAVVVASVRSVGCEGCVHDCDSPKNVPSCLGPILGHSDGKTDGITPGACSEVDVESIKKISFVSCESHCCECSWALA